MLYAAFVCTVREEETIKISFNLRENHRRTFFVLNYPFEMLKDCVRGKSSEKRAFIKKLSSQNTKEIKSEEIISRLHESDKRNC